MAAKAGQPTKYNKKIADDICGHIVKGLSTREIERIDGMPCMKTIFNWLNDKDKEYFLQQYTRAKEVQTEHLAEEMLEIADDAQNDWMKRQGKEDEDYWVANGEHIQRSRLRIETRKWLMGKLKPKKYGEKQMITGPNGDDPVQFETITRTIVDPKGK